MKARHISLALANFAATMFLLTLIAAPFFFAHNMVKVAGIKTAANSLVSSQIDRFNNLTLTQQGKNYQITYTKTAPDQVFQGILILTNPTAQTRVYTITKLSGDASVFFGEDWGNSQIQITLPSGASTPVSLYSSSLDQGATVEFSIN